MQKLGVIKTLTTMENKNLVTYSGIPESEVKTMVETYQTFSEKHPDYDPNTHVKCIWFKIDEIAGLIDQAKKEGADGIRIYLGRYPADVSKFVKPTPRADTNSVILVSTGLDENGNKAAKADYFVDIVHAVPANRGEQCQPDCDGVKVN